MYDIIVESVKGEVLVEQRPSLTEASEVFAGFVSQFGHLPNLCIFVWSIEDEEAVELFQTDEDGCILPDLVLLQELAEFNEDHPEIMIAELVERELPAQMAMVC